jgi:hypothetical protein
MLTPSACTGHGAKLPLPNHGRRPHGAIVFTGTGRLLRWVKITCLTCHSGRLARSHWMLSCWHGHCASGPECKRFVAGAQRWDFLGLLDVIQELEWANGSWAGRCCNKLIRMRIRSMSNGGKQSMLLHRDTNMLIHRITRAGAAYSQLNARITNYFCCNKI